MTLQVTYAYSTKSATVSNTVKAISHASFSWGTTDLAQAQRAFITATAQDIRYRWDDTDPSAANSHVIVKDALRIEIVGNKNIQSLKFIRDTGAAGDATIEITLEKF